MVVVGLKGLGKAGNKLNCFKMVGLSLTELGFVPSEVAAEFADPENAILEGWPAGLSYADLEQKVSEKVPSLKISQNELALLTIWLTGRLPGAAG
mgnify:CR=1 FL=1